MFFNIIETDRLIIRELAKAIINFGFKKLNLHRIFATCHPDNIGSAKVMEKIGMQKGKWRDSFIYSILDYEYDANS
jgi:ribosomal-protein-alanine N-acetyltransferase